MPIQCLLEEKKLLSPVAHPSSCEVGSIHRMTEILRRLTSNPLTTIELLIVSLLINLLALAVPIFVIQVLKRYVAYGIDATLATLTGGALLAIVFEFIFRLLRNRMILPIARSSEYHSKILYYSLASTKAILLNAFSDDLRYRILRALKEIEDAYSCPNIAIVLDLPFVPIFLGALYLLNPSLFLVASFLVFIGFIVGVGAHLGTRSLTADFLAAAGRNNALTHSFFKCVDTIRMFNNGTSLREAWIKSSDQMWHLGQKLDGRKELGQGFIHIVIGLTTISMIGIGSVFVVSGDLGVGELIGANILAARALFPIVKYSQAMGNFAIGTQSIKVLDGFGSLAKENAEGIKIKSFQGEIELHGLGFTYPANKVPLFQSISLRLAPSEALVVTGPNGSGKSTFARIILGLLDPGNGKISLDGVDLQLVNPQWWRNQVIYLPQEPYFLDGTIRDNILMPNPILKNKDLENIIKNVGLKMFFDQSEKGLDTVITNHGMNLSFGIRRRIALARALVNNGRVVLFDEPTEGMDPWGCSVIYTMLNEFIKAGKTIIAISHDKYILQGAKYILNLQTKPVPRIFAKDSQPMQVKEELDGEPSPEPMPEYAEPKKPKKKVLKRKK